jgi:hypothetical protein
MLGRLPGKSWLEVAGKVSKYKYQILIGATRLLSETIE